MSVRRAVIAVALTLAALPAAGQTARRIDEMAITYRSATSVYVSGGRAAGLAVGDRLTVFSGRQAVAELEVSFLAEHSASCRVVSQTGPMKTGHRVARIGPTRAPSPAPAPTPSPRAESAAPSAPAAPVPAPTVYPPRRSHPYGRFTGGLSLGYGGFWDSSTSNRDITEFAVRYDLSARGLGGQPLEARVRGTNRHITRTGVRGVILSDKDSRDRLYEASLAYAPMGGRVSATAGRIGAYPFASIGYLDGAIAEVRPTANLQLGGFGGNTIRVGGAAGGTTVGGFVRIAPRATRLHYEVVVSGIRENDGGDVSREYLGLQGQLRTGGLWLYQWAEIDLNRGWRADRASASTQITNARSLVSWRQSPTRSVSVSYEQRRSFWDAFNRELPIAAFDDRSQQTLRADVDLARANSAGIWVGASLRRRDGDDRQVYDVHAGFRTSHFLSLRTSIEGTVYRTLTSTGVLASARLGRDLRGGHRVDLSYNFTGYDVLGLEERLQSQWVRLSAYGHIPRGVYGRGDLEYGFGNDLRGVRALLEAGWRF